MSRKARGASGGFYSSQSLGNFDLPHPVKNFRLYYRDYYDPVLLKDFEFPQDYQYETDEHIKKLRDIDEFGGHHPYDTVNFT